MIIKDNESLSNYTTFRMGGIAKHMYFPEDIDELCKIIQEIPGIEHYAIGGGSNLLINDKRDFENVLCLRNFSNKIERLGECEYSVGASVRLQKLINTINNDGNGGIEYLYSVPGLIGGAVYMNAGRGQEHHQCLSDYILDVTYLLDGKIETIPRDECEFEYRSSIFKKMPGAIILNVRFRFVPICESESTRLKQERIELCKRHQDNSAPNFGSVFRRSNKAIMEFVRLVSKLKSNDCHYSAKTRNWLLHPQTGTFEQAVKHIENVEKLHRCLGLKCLREVIIWE